MAVKTIQAIGVFGAYTNIEQMVKVISETQKLYNTYAYLIKQHYNENTYTRM